MKKLKEYNEKRDFELTNEPKGKTKKSKQKIFVVQYHEARAKHFDFRLEWSGVLLSWAVPKGPSQNPKDKRLAIMVEDHPIDYAGFEGIIPKGQYGAGTVIVFDKGTWKPEKNFEKDLEKGNVKFFLEGEKFKGKFALIKIEGKNWLLIKENDEFAKNKSGVAKEKTSIISGKTSNQLGKPKNPFSKFDVELAKLEKEIPSGNDWIFEIKYDGYRIIANIENGKVKLYTRNFLDYTKKFPVIVQQLSNQFSAKSVILDGEIVCPDEKGRSDFGALQSYLKNSSGNEVSYMIFDILALDGKDLRTLPLLERKKLLTNVLKGAKGNLKESEYVRGHGEKCFSAVKKLGLEGIVGKKVDSKYSGKRNGDWIKIKSYNRQEFIVCGYTLSDKKAGIGALILGAKKSNKFVYVGRAGTGFGEKEGKELISKFNKLKRKNSPFNKELNFGNEEIFWIKPCLVAEIQFAEITKDNLLRQASFKGLRDDKKSDEVIVEEVNKVLGIEISSPERILYKDKNISKFDVAKYYETVGERMLPYIEDRLLSVVRCHDEVNKEKFFKKHPDTKSVGVINKKIKNSDGEESEYFYVESEQGIISQVQLGTVEFHTWGSTVKNLNKADTIVFDLDPDIKIGLDKVRQGAKDLKNVLDELGLKSFVKTSGGKGYHVVVPLKESSPWEKVGEFAKKVAEFMEEKWPERYTTNIRKEKRKGKIFIDWVRNGRGATSVAPYSLRARTGAFVSAPISWKELDEFAPNGIDMEMMKQRIKKVDPWKGYFDVNQKIK
ncbi:MAG: DNA ligase D [Firmicutes bacterium]|nr:DNA ligase D [Bacillota bacterium]MDY3658797.1 DNA ligase D [Eubacteriales bacterium]